MKIILKAIIFSLFLNASGFAEVNFQQKKFYYENLVKNWSKTIIHIDFFISVDTSFTKQQIQPLNHNSNKKNY